MAVQQQVRLLLLAILLLVTTQTTQTCSDDDLYVIRSTAPNGLVLDATNPDQVTIQHYTGFRPQLWRLERTEAPNMVYIVNNYTGEALDFVKRGELLDVVTSKRRNILRQQWNLAMKGRITNGENGKNVDVNGANFSVGNRLIVWENNNNKAQDFVFQKKL